MTVKEIFYCAECNRVFSKDVKECPDCGDDGWIRSRLECKCPFCDVVMDAVGDDYFNEEYECPSCDLYLSDPKVMIPFFNACLIKYNERKSKECEK